MRVVWAGWESTTLALQQNGWQLSVEEDISRYSIRLALYHPYLRFKAISQHIEFEHMAYFERQNREYVGGNLPIIGLAHVACDLRVSLMENSIGFKPIDATPQWLTMESPKDITDFHIFRSLQAQQEIIVEPESIDELMEKILSMQSPKQHELRQKRLRQTELPDNVLEMGKYKEIYNPKTDIIAQVVAVG